MRCALALLLLGSSVAVRAAAPPTNEPITQVESIRRLTREEANRGLKVQLRGVVTFAREPWGNLFIQDETGGIGAWPWLKGCTAKTGDRIEFEGVTEQTGFGPALRPSKVTLLGQAIFPSPLRHSLSYMLTGKDDAQWVEIEGVVRRFSDRNLYIMVEGGEVATWVEDFGELRPESLIDAAVRVQGVCMPKWNDRNQIIAIRVVASTRAQLQVLHAPPADPFALPVTPIEELMRYNPEGSALARSHRVKVSGVVSSQAGPIFFLQDHQNGARIESNDSVRAKPGDRLEVVGFVKAFGFSPMLTDCVIRKTGHSNPPPPIAATLESLFSGELDAKRVRVRGRVIEIVEQRKNQVLQLQLSNRVVRAVIPTSAKLQVPVGSVVEVVGVCSVLGAGPASVFENSLLLADLYPSSANEVTLVQRPPWWTLRHAFAVIGVLAAATLLALLWARTLRQKVDERTRELRHEIAERIRVEEEMGKTHKLLVSASRQAGMAEVATSVLHNVGNVLNSVNVSAGLVHQQVSNWKVGNLTKAAAMLAENAGNPGFLSEDEKGKQLPNYLLQFTDRWCKQQETVLSEIRSLTRNIEHIKDIVAMQQAYGKVSGVRETVQITELLEDALRMNAGALSRHDVQVVREYAEVQPVHTDKHKVLQILVNLIRNAKHACDESGRTDKRLTLRVNNNEGRIKIAVVDNGVGIAPENLTRIFNHGFTTRKDGHGFGLHSGALAAKELGGTLNVQSEGLGRGAAFTLELPIELAKEHSASDPAKRGDAAGV